MPGSCLFCLGPSAGIHKDYQVRILSYVHISHDLSTVENSQFRFYVGIKRIQSALLFRNIVPNSYNLVTFILNYCLMQYEYEFR